jgi:hypothetical protein
VLEGYGRKPDERLVVSKYSWVAVLCSFLTSGCGPICPPVPCPAPGNSIGVVTNGVKVKSLTLSGLACAGAQIGSSVGNSTSSYSSTSFEPDALAYDIGPTSAGECDVQIKLETGEVLQRTIAFTYRGGCCQTYASTGNNWFLDAPDAGM